MFPLMEFDDIALNCSENNEEVVKTRGLYLGRAPGLPLGFCLAVVHVGARRVQLAVEADEEDSARGLGAG